MTLLQTVQVSSSCTSVCQYEGNTYVGLHNQTIDRIDGSYQLSKSFLSGFSNLVGSVRVYKDRVYSLVPGNPHIVDVRDLMGNFITCWYHEDSYRYHANQLVIIDDQVIIPNRQTKQLTFYSLTGEVIKQLPCPLFGNQYVAMCAANNQSVIVSDYKSSQVFKVNISTGEVIWTCKQIPLLGGVACGRTRVFVANSSTKIKIWILDVNTG